MPGLFGQIGSAHVRRLTGEYHERPCTGLRRQFKMLRPRLRVQDFGRQFTLTDAVITLLQIHLVAARNEIHASILDRRIFQRKPESDT